MPTNPLLGIAGRWLREQLSTDHHADTRIARIEREAHLEVQEQVGQALLPGLHRRNEERAAASEARAAAEAQQRVAAMAISDGCALAVRGDLTAQLPSRLRVDAQLDEGVLLLEVVPHEAVPAGLFRSLALAIPGFAGVGRHDLAAAHDDDWDPLWFGLVMDVEDEPFWWAPPVGGCLAVVDGEGLLHLAIDFEDAAGRRVHLAGSLPLPPLG